jgi:hypothetical protein
MASDPVGVWRAVLDVAPARIELRVRPPVVRVLLLMEDLMAVPDDGVVVFPAHQEDDRGRWGRKGVEIRGAGSSRYWDRRWGRRGARMPSYYFWTRQRDEVLAAAAAAGFEVSGQEQWIWPRPTSD